MNDVPVRVRASTPERHPAASETLRNEQMERQSVHKKQRSRKVLVVLIAGILALGVLSFGGYLVYRSSVGAQIDSSKQQAVFFTNGQAYFGKLERLQGGYYKLNDIYYLQTKSSDADGSANPQDAASQSDSNVELIKLGSEIHGPEDAMVFHREQILYFENLTETGRVSEAIANFKSR